MPASYLLYLLTCLLTYDLLKAEELAHQQMAAAYLQVHPPFCLRSRPVTLDPAPFATPAAGSLARLARAPVHIPWNPCAPALTSGAHAPTFTFCRTALSAFCTGDLAWQIVAQDTSPRTSGSDTEGLMLLKATNTAAYFGHGDGRDGGRMVCERGRSDERCVLSCLSGVRSVKRGACSRFIYSLLNR